ncbi:PA0069 family radical SAM protein [Cereibacter sphaeroides]|uniref:PA0069 family radical SAM protein n=1 Tax=Cereibacter sphaeroides TaxID=1063 RepID=UPI001F323576|nr:PA0069 family radical SAM protein [Cereibacter sphaeroides]MCE6960301.1 PA0069 family radical SAM protein [Cereibacter sphaeroides]MCE6974912.1 PA0069 family radical SAM protein [Cereibacter sphaeroides]
MKSTHSSLDPALRLRARGAASNESGRFEPAQREAFADGWDLPEDERLLRTEVRIERPRSALTFNRSPDIPFDRSVNPYRGCEHGCIYCFARPTHAYLNLSPGLDFETRLIARPGIAAVLERELRAKSYRVAPVALGTNTDPYQPVEARHRVMREVLEVLAAFRHPVAITTKGTLIERDLDLLAPMAAEGLLRVGLSVTTLDADLSRRLEPRAPPPARRLETIRRLAAAGIPVRAMVAPVIPGLTDPEIEAILAAVADAGAVAATWIMLRLPLEVAPLVKAWAEEHYPDRAGKILARIREIHGGRDYDPAWGKRMRGEGVWADLVSRRFRLAAARHGLDRDQPPLRRDLFTVPPRPGDQLRLF